MFMYLDGLYTTLRSPCQRSTLTIVIKRVLPPNRLKISHVYVHWFCIHIVIKWKYLSSVLRILQTYLVHLCTICVVFQIKYVKVIMLPREEAYPPDIHFFRYIDYTRPKQNRAILIISDSILLSHFIKWILARYTLHFTKAIFIDRLLFIWGNSKMRCAVRLA